MLYSAGGEYYMGKYLNPGNLTFAEIREDNYVDKTGLIDVINHSINKNSRLSCVSRPRRFGKSFAAAMLCAYYDRSCDSHEIFGGLEISKTADYEKHLNQYNVICLDISDIIGTLKDSTIVEFIQDNVKRELMDEIPGLKMEEGFSDTLLNAVELTGSKFVMVIDEWDIPIREMRDQVDEYLRLLRALFKSSITTNRIFAAVYMTGILPIKKNTTGSALSNFEEYTILDTRKFMKYTGFLEDEVKKLCEEKNVDFNQMKEWYDGYALDVDTSVYNPYSVMKALEDKSFKSYWKKTSAVEELLTYIDMNMDGLQEDIVKLMGGEKISVNVSNFANDTHSLYDKNDVLTLLIHLGYLTYEAVQEDYGLVSIPNKEIQSEFDHILKRGRHDKLIKLVQESDKLLNDTLQGNGDAVAAVVDKVRSTNYAPTYYNDEQALRSVIRMAYITCVDQYIKIEELPSGHGIADVVYLPVSTLNLPALIIEIKWNRTSEGAIAQIKNNNYPAVIKEYFGEIVLVGIDYDEKNKKHTCTIEKFIK